MYRGTNPYLHKRWDPQLRLFTKDESGPQSTFPLDFGYEAVGVCAWSRHDHVRVGDILYGNWGHREWVTLKGDRYRSQLLPRAMSICDGIYPGQMGPIALNGVLHAAGRHQGTTTVVFGAGVVGLLVAQIVRADRAARVVVVDRVPFRLAAARHLGFETLDASEVGDTAYALKRWIGGVGVAFECTGAYPALAEAVRCVANRGMVVTLGFYQGGAADLYLGEEFHHNRVRLICAQIGALPEHLYRKDAEYSFASLSDEILRLAVAGEIRLGELITDIVPVDRAAEALDLVLQGSNEALQVALSYPSAQ